MSASEEVVNNTRNVRPVNEMHTANRMVWRYTLLQ